MRNFILIIIFFINSCCNHFSGLEKCKKYQYFNKAGQSEEIIYKDSFSIISLNINIKHYKDTDSFPYFDSNNFFYYMVEPVLNIKNVSKRTLTVANDLYNCIYIKSLNKKKYETSNFEMNRIKFENEIKPLQHMKKSFSLVFKIDSINLKYYFKNKLYIDLGTMVVNGDTVVTNSAMFYKRH